jgi:hypothetical protein
MFVNMFLHVLEKRGGGKNGVEKGLAADTLLLVATAHSLYRETS